jgi:hypothetical protein
VGAASRVPFREERALLCQPRRAICWGCFGRGLLEWQRWNMFKKLDVDSAQQLVDVVLRILAEGVGKWLWVLSGRVVFNVQRGFSCCLKIACMQQQMRELA